MKQAELLVMADYALPPEMLPQTIAEVRLLDWPALAMDADFQAGFISFPEQPEPQMAYLGYTQEGDRLLQWCGIRIRISRHVIAFHLPVLFKTWLDFEACRIGLDRFLCTFLRPFQSGNMLFLPSFWIQPENSIHNELHRKRLAQMQNKITQAETSFKRCRQHLAHCLGNTAENWREADEPTYKGTSFFNADAGRLCCVAALPPDTFSLADRAERMTERLRFTCRPHFRENACAYAPYMRKRVSEPRGCRLLPAFDHGKYPDFRTAVATEGVARWNAHCFFSLTLHPDRLTVRFRKTATGLLYGPDKSDCIGFFQELLAPLHPTELLLCSHTLLDEVPETNDFKGILNYLQQHYTGYSDLDDIASWNLAFIHGGW